jgi:predicted PurR-regulated permease PerM
VKRHRFSLRENTGMTRPGTVGKENCTYMERPEQGEEEPGHLSEMVTMRHWLSLLTVVSTVLMLMLFVGVSVRLLSYIGHTLLIFALGGLFAYAFGPIVEMARWKPNGRKSPRWRGVLCVYAALFTILAAGGILLGRQLNHQIGFLGREHTQLEARGRERLARLDTWLVDRGMHANLTDMLNHPPAGVKTWGEAIAKNALGLVEGLSKSVVEGIIVLLIALYFLIYSTEMREGLNSKLPSRFRPYAEQWQSDVNRILGGFVRGQLVLAVVMGTLAAIICVLLGIRLWLLIGMFVVVASLIPVFGPYIGAVPAMIAAALTPEGHGLSPVVRVVAVLLLFIVINEIGSKILYPRLVGAALGLHEVLVLFVLFAGLEVGHIWGVLFAAPLTALTIVTLSQLYRFWQGLPPLSLSQSAERGGAEAKQHGTP